jgi:hypothetical protein
MGDSGIERIMAEGGEQVETDPRSASTMPEMRTGDSEDVAASADAPPAEESTDESGGPTIDSKYVDLKLDSDSLTAVSTTLDLLIRVL